MRTCWIALVLTTGTMLISCNRDTNNDARAAARQAGRDAYRAAEAAKRDAKEAARELQHASRDFRDGWEQAKHEEPVRPREDPPPPPRRDRDYTEPKHR